MEKITNSSFQKFENNQISDISKIYGGANWTPTYEQVTINGCCVDYYDKINTRSNRVKRVKMIMNCVVVESYDDPEFDGITEWDEVDENGVHQTV